MNMLKRLMLAGALACFASGAMAASTQSAVTHLNQVLDGLASDPLLGHFAVAERSLARQSVEALAADKTDDRAHALYMAQRQVKLARVSAKLAQARDALQNLKQEHAEILLEASRRDAEATRRELERAQLSNQVAAEHSSRLQAIGDANSKAAEKARAAARQAYKVAKAKAKAAAAAKHEADVAEKTVKLMHEQLKSFSESTGSGK